MSECSLVHEPCRRPEKIGGLAQVLQRRTPTWGDRPTDADYVAESRWRSQPAVVNEPENSTRRRSKVRPHCTSRKTLPAGDPKFGLTAEGIRLKLTLVRRIKAGHRDVSRFRFTLMVTSLSTFKVRNGTA